MFRRRPQSLQSTLMLTFSGLSVVIILITGALLYVKFVDNARTRELAATQEALHQTKDTLEDYLTRMRQIADTAYYNVVKENDVQRQSAQIHTGLNTLYEGNRDELITLALYNDTGNLVLAEPVVTQKNDPQVAKQSWFKRATAEPADVHFSRPHVQNLFDLGTQRFQWVISLSRAVELSRGGQVRTGVLLVDMDYYRIAHLLAELNDNQTGKYYYLADDAGHLLYHPRLVQLQQHLTKESTLAVVDRPEGVYHIANQQVAVSDIGYTGWKLVGVVPPATIKQDMVQTGLFIGLYIVLMSMVLVMINRLIAIHISRPLQRLNRSVQAYDGVTLPEIDIGGSSEIRQLGRSINNSYQEIEALMAAMVQAQNARRKSELAVLQSQINPHFLYNTLESITWMIEGEQNDQAVFMITQLAQLFRISLSKGRSIISIDSELKHAQSYMNIQAARYKQAFSLDVDVADEIRNLCIVKLVLQPILENVLNYGLQPYDDEPLLIRVAAKREDDDVIIAISDNGNGMDEATVAAALTPDADDFKHGSGVGLVNVDTRLKLYFGDAYGLSIASAVDVGTTVTMKIPAIPYSEATRQQLEGAEHE